MSNGRSYSVKLLSCFIKLLDKLTGRCSVLWDSWSQQATRYTTSASSSAQSLVPVQTRSNPQHYDSHIAFSQYLGCRGPNEYFCLHSPYVVQLNAGVIWCTEMLTPCLTVKQIRPYILGKISVSYGKVPHLDLTNAMLNTTSKLALIRFFARSVGS